MSKTESSMKTTQNRAMKLKTAMCYALNIFDLAVTTLLVRMFGIDVEYSTIGRAIITSPIMTVGVKVTLVGAFLMFLYATREKMTARIGVNVILVAYSALFAYHLMIIFSLVRLM